ncbi:uncharacterized protein LY79DRAFT_257235 [Colletotrichum navitas]|uniref:Uncharacterized protein n=1 Tax=Colletotrichum navitas TaxID=681940 RepID=A0AAD8VBT9_9PEZI|nr:uncharacterized protein LY79DRAFT_257235 [Colletotrichum navitas]KAK1598805.1 hypothetical protein LY79DRAFT_257235 [Colletotrichum navitas]
MGTLLNTSVPAAVTEPPTSVRRKDEIYRGRPAQRTVQTWINLKSIRLLCAHSAPLLVHRNSNSKTQAANHSLDFLKTIPSHRLLDTMSGLLSARLAGRRLVWPVGSGICVAYSLHCRQNHNYFNSHLTSSASPTPRAQSRSFGGLSPDAMRQLSSGTLSGFSAGLLLAHRHGLDLPRLLGAKERLNKAVLTRPFHNVVFRLSFAATFTLAAFVRF